MPPWNVAEGEPLGHGADDAGAVGRLGGVAVAGGSQFWGSDGAGIVPAPAGGAVGTVGTVTVDDGGTAAGIVAGAGEVTAPGTPLSGRGLGK